MPTMKGMFKRSSKPITQIEASFRHPSSPDLAALGSGEDQIRRPRKVSLLKSPDHQFFCAVRSQWDWVLEELCQHANDAYNTQSNITKSDEPPKRKLTAVGSAAELPSGRLLSLGVPEKVPGGVESSPDSSTNLDARVRNRRRPPKSATTPGSFTLCVEVVCNHDIPGQLIKYSDMKDNRQWTLQAFHGTSEAFDGLDDKDEFVRTLKRCRCEHLELSPPSQLINWDVTKEECRNLVGDALPVLLGNDQAKKTNSDASSAPRVAVLKEPMGSKGNGIFFVKDADEIHEIIEGNRKKAVDEPGFLDQLIAQKGRIPSWVLQAEVQPCLLLNDRRKFHIRSYVLCVEQVHLEEGAGDEEELMKMYVYNRHEIRIASAPVSETEDPGNRDRSAHITQHGDISERRLLQDVPELVERKLQQKVELFAAQIFAKHLHSDIERRIALSASAMEEQNDAANGCSVLPHKFALAGLDLMVTEDDRIYLLEVNVNPGAPPAETVPVDVQDHLIGFLYDVVKVVTGGGSSSAMNFSSTDEILRRTI